MTTLNVSTIVELAVDTVLLVADVAALQDTTEIPLVIGLVPLNVVVAVDDVVTADVIEDTVVETVGPSGCLTLPILRPAYSVNHTFTVPSVSM